MLALTCERARLADGDRILELAAAGARSRCGWLRTIQCAHHRAVSNSRSQKAFIDARAAERGLSNVEVITCDATCSTFPRAAQFDRVVSGRDVRAHAQLPGAARPASPAGCGRGARCSCTSSRTRASRTLSRCAARPTGWRSTSSPAASCRATTCCSTSSVTCAAWSTGALAARTTRRRPRRGSPTWIGGAPRSCRCSRPPTAPRKRAAGGCTGACSSCRAPSCSGTGRQRVDRVALPVREALTPSAADDCTAARHHVSVGPRDEPSDTLVPPCRRPCPDHCGRSRLRCRCAAGRLRSARCRALVSPAPGRARTGARRVQAALRRRRVRGRR